MISNEGRRKFLEVLRVAKENGFELRHTIKVFDGYVKVLELVSEDRNILVARYSAHEKFERSEEDILNDILNPVNYDSEFKNLFGCEQEANKNEIDKS